MLPPNISRLAVPAAYVTGWVVGLLQRTGVPWKPALLMAGVAAMGAKYATVLQDAQRTPPENIYELHAPVGQRGIDTTPLPANSVEPVPDFSAACIAQNFYQQAPEILNVRLQKRAVPLCTSAFALLHSGVARTSLYAAEMLTPARIAQARTLPREGEFVEETSLPYGHASTLRSYYGSGYDRGHLAPNGDMPDKTAQAASFSLANIIPQDQVLNRNLWAWIEHAVRNDAVRGQGATYVITGPSYQTAPGQQLMRIGGVSGVLVPTAVYKAVYRPGYGGYAYWAPNNRSGTYEVLSLAQLQTRIGLNLFPSVPAPEQQRLAQAPVPRPYEQ